MIINLLRKLFNVETVCPNPKCQPRRFFKNRRGLLSHLRRNPDCYRVYDNNIKKSLYPAKYEIR